VPETDEVLGGHDGSGEIVGVHGGQARRTGVRVDRDDGDAVFGVHHGGRYKDRAVDQGAAEPGEVAPFPAGVPAGPAATGVGKQVVAASANRF
jgi:hypothetical protein